MRAWILQFLGWFWFFLFWVNYLGQVVSSFSNGWFKNFLKKYTSSNIKAFGSGILITSILQSSNIVSVLVLAFVWTGILSLSSALSIVLWANIGTMITTSLLWIVGLSLNVAVIAFPLIFLGAIGMNFLTRWDKVVIVSKFLLGLGLIFLAFSFMKDWLSFLTDIDFSAFNWMCPWVGWIIWLLLTLLIQSGSLTFIIALAILSTGILEPNMAFAIVFGGYLGSTITIVIWALWRQWVAIKRQVATWHVWFNLITSIVWMCFLSLISKFYISILQPSVWTVIGFALCWIGRRSAFALLALPFVSPVAEKLQQYIKDKSQALHLAIHKIINVEDLDPSVPLLAAKQDMLLLFWNAIKYNLNAWDFSISSLDSGSSTEEKLAETLGFKWNFDRDDLSKVYHDVKYIQNELLWFLSSLPVSEKSPENAELYQWVLAVLDSCKTIKDVRWHIEDWQRSDSEQLQKDYEETRQMVLKFYSAVLHLYQRFDNKKWLADLHVVLEEIQKENDQYLAALRPHKNDDVVLTALIQTRRYFVQSCEHMLRAIENFHLSTDEVGYFKENMATFMK